MAALLHVLLAKEAEDAGAACADGREEAAYLLLKDDDQCNHSHADHLVEDGAEQAHIEHLRHNYPRDNEDDDAGKDVGGIGALHHLVDVKQQQCYKDDVDNILNSYCYHILYICT